MRTSLSRYIDLTDSEYKSLLSKSQLRTYKKKEKLLNAGESTQKLFFLKSGLVRGYRIIDGIDVTHHFFTPGWWATDYQSYLTGEKGELFLESLSSVEVFQFAKADIEMLYQLHHNLERVGRIMAEHAYLTMVDRSRSFQTKNLKSRYIALIESSPALLKKVPQKYIASYLGVAPQSLSRVREALKNDATS